MDGLYYRLILEPVILVKERDDSLIERGGETGGTK